MATWLWLASLLAGVVTLDRELALRAVIGPGLVGVWLLPVGVGLLRQRVWAVAGARRAMWFLLGVSLVAWLWQDGPRLFVGVIAPRLFDVYLELHAGLALIAGLVLLPLAGDLLAARREGRGVAVGLVFALGRMVAGTRRDVIDITRNFYGVLRVRDERLGEAGPAIRRLVHGRTFHGLQFQSGPLRGEPTSYYGRHTAIGLLLGDDEVAGLDQPSVPRRIGIIGLGVGTLSVYGRRGDLVRFYELDPQVHRMAEQHFSYLSDARMRGVKVEVEVGDARLVLGRQSPQAFDVLVLDAFTSDAIPVHLLTREAFAVYRKHLAPDGVLALHLTSSHFHLQPVVAAVAETIVMTPVAVASSVASGASVEDRGGGHEDCLWMLLTRGDPSERVPACGRCRRPTRRYCRRRAGGFCGPTASATRLRS